MQQVQTPDLLKFLGKDGVTLVLNWLEGTLKGQQRAYNSAPTNELSREQGKVQMLEKLMLDINGCITSKTH